MIEENNSYNRIRHSDIFLKTPNLYMCGKEKKRVKKNVNIFSDPTLKSEKIKFEIQNP